MKKSLLLFLSAATTAMAVSGAELKEPSFYSNTAIQNVSPNGKWAASEVYGTVILFNLDTGEKLVFEAGEAGTPYYTLGLGNTLSDTGILMCSTETNSDATYWENGEWKTLKMGEAKNANSSANGITPDGSRICGNLGLMQTTLEDVTMIVPAVWDRQADGSYGDYVVLPHPELDFSGRAPQYITAVAISDDGRTVLGQIVDCRGSFHYPIVYTQGADGQWSYSLPTESLINPNHVVMPENPGDSPTMPQPMSYLDESGLAAYQEAYEKWVSSGYDQSLYPDYVDFMTEEKRAEYKAADEAYNEALQEWSVKYDAFDAAYWEIVDASPNFQFNEMALSPDGKFFAMSNCMEDDSDPYAWFPVTIDHVWVMDTDGGEITKYENRSLGVKAWGGDYVLAVETDQNSSCFNGYLLKDGEETSLYDYLCSKGEAIKEWVDLNLTHETEVYDWETETVVIKNEMYTGLPVASRDLSVIASWTQTNWGDYTPESYLFDFRDAGGVNIMEADKKGTVAFDANGNLTVGTGVVDLAVFEVGGTCVLRVSDPDSTVACDLSKGIYIVKATFADGSSVVAKAVK